MTQTSLTKKSQAGFTLVELAIVMIIIGLLIGGVLKGQELIGNAQVAATASQVKAYDTATTTFHDIYDGLPGDLATAAARVPNCAGIASCVAAGANGNGFVDAHLPGAAEAAGSENEAYWVQLHAADLIGGVDTTSSILIHPEGKIAGRFQVGYYPGAAGGLGNNPDAFRGHYISLQTDPTAAAADDTLSASQAARLDRKLDDGQADAGSVFTNANTCDTAGAYDEADQTVTCDLMFRIQ